MVHADNPGNEDAPGPLALERSDASETASVHSLPVVRVTDSGADSPTQQPASPATGDDFLRQQQQRRSRHRSAIEPRASNRLSGFFSNLIHRRDAPAREPVREDAPVSEKLLRQSRPSSPRPLTPPPPALPPPTLQELGLSLTAVTSDLSPSHFASPPVSGAFLAPHYLLLCHTQGLDVLPLVSPPAPQPYALVRRISFKSVVVMEQRGVLVAIAGRRDGVRVYALEEVKKAIEWRIDAEVKRERERSRKENVKNFTLRGMDINEPRGSAEKTRKASLSTPPGDMERIRTSILRKTSHNPLPPSSSFPPVPLVPRSATPRGPKKRSQQSIQIPPNLPDPSSYPPPYINSSEIVTPTLRNRPSYISLNSGQTSASVSNVLSTANNGQTAGPSRPQDDSKADWAEDSDEEAINVVAAGTSGSHLDERTSTALPPNQTLPPPQLQPIISHTTAAPVTSGNARRSRRPSNLDLSLAISSTIIPAEPSPTPTLLTLRQALIQSPEVPNPHTPFVDGDEDDENADGHISLAQALLESRIPELPPVGTRRAQEAILLSSSQQTEQIGSLGRSDANSASRRRRRWSIMISSPSNEIAMDPSPSVNSPSSGLSTTRFYRSHSLRSSNPQIPHSRSVTDPLPPTTALSSPDILAVAPSRASRFIPRFISDAFHFRRSRDRLRDSPSSPIDLNEGIKWNSVSHQAPAPKLEYVKLPGTKGALLVKAVETVKKSFLAILCGDSGEKVELFAGTYRTALGLSRTFILPDSPRSLELQLQGDDLVEVFLVFAQNVFGLEPATVRVREVRIGRAERRAARRRARENRPGAEPTSSELEQFDEETNVNVSIGVSVGLLNGYERPGSPMLVASDHPGAHVDRPQTPEPPSSIMQTEELVMLTSTQMGPYTTFQQLSFAPNFPLASIADDYVIPPTYPSFLENKAQESDNIESDLVQTQFSPPGLPVPTPTAPPKWYYRDPRNVVHGPWKSSLMQSWYKDGLLPPDLPVRREEDNEYILLKDLRLLSVDPTQPFRVVVPLVNSEANTALRQVRQGNGLLHPISLLEQPRHFGPPALFFSSRGGYSTAIIDARGRSVLKGKFVWSNDAEVSKLSPSVKMGDIMRLEAFEVKKGSVLVAMKQGGLEVVDIGDALLRPADKSRTDLPNYSPPLSNINRRAPFIWRKGTPLVASSNQVGFLKIRSDQPAGRKNGSNQTKYTNTRADSFPGDFDVLTQEEFLFLGRKDDEVFFCEKNTVSFRILRLSVIPYNL